MSVTPEIQSFYDDAEALGCISDSNGWHVDSTWAHRFQLHLSKLLPEAEEGNPVAQKEVANIYFGGYLYPSEALFLESFPTDIVEATRWWLAAASGGEYPCMHLVLAAGVGAEADRVRTVLESCRGQLSGAPPPSMEWQKDMRRLYVLAYPDS